MSKLRGSLGRFAPPKIIQPVLGAKVTPLNLSATALSVRETTIELEASDTNQIIKTYQPIQTPRSETSENRPLFHSVSSMVFDLNSSVSFTVEPKIMESPPEEQMNVFIDKCEQCLQMCDFSSESSQKEQKEMKSQILADILAAVADPNIVAVMKQAEYSALYHAFRKNVIRATAKPPRVWFAPVAIDFTIDRVEEAGWVHLNAFYDILLTFISNRRFDATLCQNDVYKVLKGVISMFQSPDTRERERVMKMFHAMYRALKKMRGNCRKLISSFLSACLHSDAPRLGASEILSALVPIIAGFKTPLHPENTEFFVKILVPLHGSPHLHMFHPSLVNAITSFVNKNSRLVYLVVEYMLDYWPVTAPTKQLLFLNEIEAFAEILQSGTVPKLLQRICKTVGFCVASENFAVSERALMLWESDAFMSLIGGQSLLTFPILIPEIYKTATSHWCSDVKALALNAMRVLKGCDVQMFDNIGNNFKKIESDKIVREVKKGTMWNNLFEAFAETEEERDAGNATVGKLYIGCDGSMQAKIMEMASQQTSPKGKPTSFVQFGKQKMKPLSGFSLTGMVRENREKMLSPHAKLPPRKR